MSTLETLDKNMAAGNDIQRDEALMFPDCFAAPFRLSGFPWFPQDGKLHRIPAHIAQKISPSVTRLATKTAGGTLSFRTDSNRLYLEAVVTEAIPTSKFSACGRSGFDVYMRRDDCNKLIFVKSVLPDPGVKLMKLDIPKISSLMLEGSSNIVEVLINFPPYDGVESLQVGLEADSLVLPPVPYAIEKPILFYGSSITQGGCASRPGNAYPNHLCRRLRANFVNFGFSGSAKGEALMAQTIAQLEMSVFVMDYDHNAHTHEHLQNTHEPFFKTVRAAHPELPIILISRPCTRPFPSTLKYKQIVRQTYENALAAGDKKVWFIDGGTLFGTTDADACTIDGTHPNDIGFLRMANTIEPVLRRALGIDSKP